MGKKVNEKLKNLKLLAPKIAVLGALTAVIIVAVVILYNRSLGWFVNNETVTGDGMGVKARSGLFEIEVTGQDQIFPYATGAPITEFISDQANGGYKKISSTSASEQSIVCKIQNEDPIEAGTNSLAPGTHGVISFYIKPTITRDFVFTIEPQKMGITYNTTTSEYEYVSTTSTLNLLRGHILLFRNRSYADANHTYFHYSNLIDSTFTYSTANNTPDSQGRYLVEIYWVWPRTFSQMVFTEDNAKLHSHSLFDAGTNLNTMISYIEDNKNYFFKFVPDITSAEYATMMADFENAYFVDLSEAYNNADQEMGDNVTYFALLMNVEAA